MTDGVMPPGLRGERHSPKSAIRRSKGNIYELERFQRRQFKEYQTRGDRRVECGGIDDNRMAGRLLVE